MEALRGQTAGQGHRWQRRSWPPSHQDRTVRKVQLWPRGLCLEPQTPADSSLLGSPQSCPRSNPKTTRLLASAHAGCQSAPGPLSLTPSGSLPAACSLLLIPGAISQVWALLPGSPPPRGWLQFLWGSLCPTVSHGLRPAPRPHLPSPQMSGSREETVGTFPPASALCSPQGDHDSL